MNFVAVNENYKNRTCLKPKDLEKSPFVQFDKWFREAKSLNIIKPNAAFLSSVNGDCQPHSRTVMVKAYDEKGFIFFTECETDKVYQIDKNNNVALLFSWLEIERQVKLTAAAIKLSIKEAFFYFSNRGEQMGCWIEDDDFLSTRALLEKQLGRLLKTLYYKGIEQSDIFCGYRIVPKTAAFWQVCKDKLYQQFTYTKLKNGWEITEN